MPLHSTAIEKHSNRVHTNADWRERNGKPAYEHQLPVYGDEQEEREDVQVRLAMRESASGIKRRGVLPEVQKDIYVRDSIGTQLSDDHQRASE